MSRRTGSFVAAIVAIATVPTAAQWINYPTPGIPRTPDGKPNLSAPAPRTSDGKPDLRGIWTMSPGRYGGNIAADLKAGEVQPWAEALYKQRREDLGKDSPFTGCLPQGPALDLNPVAMSKIVQTPWLIVILVEDLSYRQIFLDGRDLPEPEFYGIFGGALGRRHAGSPERRL